MFFVFVFFFNELRNNILKTNFAFFVSVLYFLRFFILFNTKKKKKVVTVFACVRFEIERKKKLNTERDILTIENNFDDLI